ncbi:response regulator [Aquincola sp. S2]|uniref:Response regulator n=1 Tax=Pseudaquabacterium terrae TaxID=2732868 RepID=A0ABX2EJ05_9BURK|nr:response regulator [Aquabacterium terrae]
MSPAPAPPRRVLYAEDDRVAALLFTEALRERGDYEVQVAEDGAEALAIVRDWPPDVLVLDAHLPDTSGLALLAQLRQLAGLANVPAFVCSADEQPEDQQRHLSAGFCGYWVKPIDRRRLLAELDRLPPTR